MINKNVIGKDVVLYKGLSEAKWIIGVYFSGDIFEDLAFGSFSESHAYASKYRHANYINGKTYFAYLVLQVSSTDTGLYIDTKENEFLLPRGKKYKIDRIDEIELIMIAQYFIKT